MTPEQTVALLFTDLVDSTALAARVGPEAAEKLRREYFTLQREAIAATGGREVKSLGDGLMVTFPSSVAATRCAVAMQQALEQRNRRAEHRLDLRVGISLGDVSADEDDYYGAPVVEGARLCNAAHGGQILASEVVRLMAGTREDYSFEPVGDLELKGFPTPVPGFEVLWQRLPGVASAIPLPPRIRSIPETGYVGRLIERAQMEECWQRVLAGGREVVLLSGEPGIGKTRLASHVAQRALQQGATVLYGACEEELAAPYQPWCEVLAHLVEHAPDELLAGHVDRHGGELSRLIPQLRRHMPLTVNPWQSDSDTGQYLLFAAITDLLEASSRTGPVVLVLDDLHWSDRESLLLLKHLSHPSAEGSMMIVGAYRDSDIGLEHPLSSTLAELRREPNVHRIALTGFDDTEVAALMEAAAGHGLDSAGLELAGELSRETNGNPFFATEILRHLAEQGAISQRPDGRWTVSRHIRDLGLPQSVREVVGYRVQRLGPKALPVLSTAAVIGRDFDLELLSRVVESEPDRVLALLEEGVSASLLRETAAVPGRFTFAHALIEHTLYSGLGRTRRARLHQQVAVELESFSASRPGANVGELARHYAAAVQPSLLEKTLYYSTRAGEQALASLAPVQARQWFERALDLEEEMHSGDAGRRCGLLISLGEAKRQSGDPTFRDTLLGAARLAQELDDVDQLASAALATSRGFTNSVGQTDAELVDLYRQTVALLPQDDPRRAHVLALLALELAHTARLSERQALADEALDIARRVGDPHLIAHVLTCHPLATADASTRDVRLAHTLEHVTLCDQLGDPTLRFHAYARRCMVLESGDVDTWDLCLQHMAEIVQIVPQPSLRWVLLFTRGPRALLAGHIDEAEALADEALHVASASGEPDARAFFGSQIFGVRYEQARLAELIDTLAQMKRANPNIPSFDPMLAIALCQAGRDAEAAALLQEAAEERFASVARGLIWLSTLGRWAVVASQVEHRVAAAELYAQMLPYADHFLWNLVGLWGAVSYHLGTLACTLGHWDAAEQHLRGAATMHRRMGAPIWLARTHLAVARLRLCGDLSAADEVDGLVEQVRQVARRHGSVVLERDAATLKRGAGPAAVTGFGSP
ncbi:MAG TPA: AAA family ATPase [Solirubrobacteraceae bacterium]